MDVNAAPTPAVTPTADPMTSTADPIARPMTLPTDDMNAAAPAPATKTPTDDQLTQQVASSYIDDYQPPTKLPAADAPVAAEITPPPSAMTSSPTVAAPTLVEEPTPPAPQAESTPPAPAQAEMSPSSVPTPALLEEDKTPALPMPGSEPSSKSAPAASSSESPSGADQPSETLEDQNIFELLGVMDANDEEKENFLDELQQIIWEDFVENDVELLLTEEELKEFKNVSGRTYENEEARQSALVEYLEKYIPDLEKIMLEKALELKEEMMRERIHELEGMNLEKLDRLTKIQQAQKMVDDQKWRSAAQLLNTL